MRQIPWLDLEDPALRFPPVREALSEPNGLLAAGGDLRPERLQLAYRHGIFPWYSAGEPILWWSPDPREVLFPAELHQSRSLNKTLRRGLFQVTMNRDFQAVIAACASAGDRNNGTWIGLEMQAAYARLHQLGAAHSIEVWQQEALVGGLYGVRSGRVFSGESMFSVVANASKVALGWLAGHCQDLGIELIDCQMPSGHLRSLGSRPMAREAFLRFLD